jgi:hypothetical protein
LVTTGCQETCPALSAKNALLSSPFFPLLQEYIDLVQSLKAKYA